MKHSFEYISILSDAWNHPWIYEGAYLNIENHPFEYLEMFHRTPGNFHLNSKRYSFYYVKCWLGCMNTILTDCMKLYSWLRKVIQSDMWKHPVEYMKYSIERMKTYNQIYENTYLNIKTTHSNTWKYSIECMKLFIRMLESTHLATWNTDLDVWT